MTHYYVFKRAEGKDFLYEGDVNANTPKQAVKKVMNRPRLEEPFNTDSLKLFGVPSPKNAQFLVIPHTYMSFFVGINARKISW